MSTISILKPTLLDKLDFKIIYELDKNARATYAHIAKQTGISKQAVQKRVEKLVDSKIITHFITIINMGAFGFSPHKIFLSLTNLSQERKKELEDYLHKNKSVGTFAFCDGIYDMYIGVSARNFEELDNELSKFYHKFADIIRAKKSISLFKTRIFSRDHLISKKRAISNQNKLFHTANNTLPIIKDIDKKLLKILSKNTRISSSNIARELQIPIQTVINRIKYLEKNHIITGYNLWVNESTFVIYKVLIELNSKSEEVESELLNFITAQPNVTFVVKTFGEWDYEFVIESRDLNECRNLINTLKRKFSQHIKGFVPLIINKVPKMNFMPNL